MSRPPKPLHPRTKVGPARLPFGPLYDELAKSHLVTVQQIATFYGTSRRTVREWSSCGVGTFLADRLAVKLKVLPYVVWGDAFFDPALMAAEAASNPTGGRRLFTDDDVRSIRSRSAAGERQCDLAREFGVSHSSIWEVVVGRNYSSVA